jgi:thiamine-monophosphate kinase
VFAVPLPEKELIARIRSSSRRRSGQVALGIGDDCALLTPAAGHQLLVTTDFTLEGIHFRREWHSPEVVGHRCLVRGLSDIAAMGGEPSAVFLSLAAPKKLPQKWIDGFLKGVLLLSHAFKVPLAGGDVAESPSGIVADIVVVGRVRKGEAILRSGAKPGDRIYVTGELGGAAATLKRLFAGEKIRPKDFPRHFHPMPRIAVGRFLRSRRLASAMIDLSDGVSTDLAHICEESGVGAELLSSAIPLARIGRSKTEVDLQTAIHGGEDYELLFTTPPNKTLPSRIAGVPVTPIGWIRRDKHIFLTYESGAGYELRPKGWEHFTTGRGAPSLH